MLQPLEASSEYVEDPKHIILTNMMLQPMRAKLRITMSYQPGSNPVSPHFKAVQMTLEYPKQYLYCEQAVFKQESMSFDGSNTPTVHQLALYPLKKLLAPCQICVLVTYN